ncbi:hypothetical protein HAX54_018823, partial [Datura stramonium]|nr:hypothetical protein [Datura stramonium]
LTQLACGSGKVVGILALSLGIHRGINQHATEQGDNEVLSKPRCAQWHLCIASNWQVRDKVLSVAKQLGEDLTRCGETVP